MEKFQYWIIAGRTRQNTEDKLNLTENWNWRKTRQNAEDKQTPLIRRGKIKIEKKTRQNAENKQTFDSNGKIEIEKKNVENKQTSKKKNEK